MVRWVVGILALTAVAAACGGSSPQTASQIRACVQKRLPAGFVDRVFASTEQGVTSVNYFHNGNEIDVTVFPSARAAAEAETAEARIGDAHDRRVRNVLYSGGGLIERAIVHCVG